MRRFIPILAATLAIGAFVGMPAGAKAVVVPVVLDPSTSCLGPSGGGTPAGTAKIGSSATTVSGSIKLTSGATPGALYYPNLVQMAGSSPLDCNTAGYGAPKTAKSSGKVSGKIKEARLASTTQVFMYLTNQSTSQVFITQTKTPTP